MGEEIKKTKSEILMEKINTLAEKIEGEENPIRRMLYSIRAKMVIAKLDREIQLQELQEKYASERTIRNEKAEKDKIDSRSDIITINQRINEIRKQLQKEEEYDPKSTNFIFGKKEIERYDGVEEYVNALKASKRPEQIMAAEKIQENYKLRRELEDLEDELEEKQFTLDEINEEKKWDDRKSKVKETALVVKSKVNIFSKIADFFRSVKESVKETFYEHKKIDEIRKKETDERKDTDNTLKEMKAKVKEEYKQKMKQLMEEYEKIQDDMDLKFNDQEKEVQVDRARTQAEKFREQMQKMAEKKDQEIGNKVELKKEPIEEELQEGVDR